MKTFFNVAAVTLAKLSLLIPILSIASCAPVTTPDNQTQSQPKQTIKITGSGSIYPALQILATAYENKDKSTKIIFLPPNQTSGGITGVKAGLVEIGAASRPLKPEENNTKIQYRKLASDALLVATHPSVKGVTNLQTKDLQAIYSGAINNWRDLGGPDAQIIILDRPEDESAKIILRQHYLGEKLKIAKSAVVLQQEKELIDTLQNTPYTIGALSLGYAITNKLPVNHLSLNGIAATKANLIASKYKMMRTIGIVWKTPPSATTQGFIEFMSSIEADKKLNESGFVPSTLTK